jgi:hypothetical protein
VLTRFVLCDGHGVQVGVLGKLGHGEAGGLATFLQ